MPTVHEAMKQIQNAGRLLIVDDVREELEDQQLMIKGVHPEYFINTTARVSEALALIEQEEPYDVVMTDMRMPEDENESEVEGEEGLRVVEAARKKDPLTEIIVLIDYDDLDSVRKALELGANQHIDKDMPNFDRAQLKVVEIRMKEVQALRQFPQTDEQILESFRGKVERVDGDVAHVTLVDSKGQEAFASYDAKKLGEELGLQDISEGTCFTCTIKQRLDDTIVEFKPIQRRQLSDEEWHRIRRETREAIGDWVSKDDY